MDRCGGCPREVLVRPVHHRKLPGGGGPQQDQPLLSGTGLGVCARHRTGTWERIGLTSLPRVPVDHWFLMGLTRPQWAPGIAWRHVRLLHPGEAWAAAQRPVRHRTVPTPRNDPARNLERASGRLQWEEGQGVSRGSRLCPACPPWEP